MDLHLLMAEGGPADPSMGVKASPDSEQEHRTSTKFGPALAFFSGAKFCVPGNGDNMAGQRAISIVCSDSDAAPERKLDYSGVRLRDG